MKLNRTCTTNMLITGSIGAIIFGLILWNLDIAKVPFVLLFFPSSYIATYLYLKLKIKNLFLAILAGGLLSGIATSEVMLIMSAVGKPIFIDMPSDIGNMATFSWILAWILSFIVGGISGIIITHRQK